MKHFYAIDLESWVYPDLEEFHNLSQKERKKLDGGYIVDSTCRLLELLEKYNTKLTFFIIGELYEWYPDLIRKIKRAGHEIAYHTHTHVLLKNKNLIEKQLALSAHFLKEFQPRGFQAPVIYFPRSGYEIIKKAGFRYSSSVYHSDIGIQPVDGVLEIPVSTFRLRDSKEEITWPRPMNFSRMLKEVPFGSSYFAALIGSLGMSYFLRAYEKMGRSAVLFIHNWQIFPPRKATYPNLSFLFRHPFYTPYLRNIKKDFEVLLRNFNFDKLEDYSIKRA